MEYVTCHSALLQKVKTCHLNQEWQREVTSGASQIADAIIDAPPAHFD
jgi:hypothetical protein